MDRKKRERGALFLTGERDQDDVELFQELWREHRGDDGAANLPQAPLAAKAVRGSWVAQNSNVSPGHLAKASSPEVQNAKARLIQALAGVMAGRHWRFFRR